MTDIITRSSGADSDTRSFAEQKRAQKRAAAEEIGVDARLSITSSRRSTPRSAMMTCLGRSSPITSATGPRT